MSALDIELTTNETAWLEDHTDSNIRVMVGTWPPFHFVEDGEPKGLAFDYVTMILDSLGLAVEPVPILWADALASIGKFEKIDVLPTIARSAEREKIVNITEDYLSFPSVIFMRKDAPFVGALGDLYGQTVALENNFIMHKRLAKDHPEINLMPLATTRDSLEAVALGRADAYVGNLAVGSYIIEKIGLANLKVAAPTDYAHDIQAIGVRRDWPELASMIGKSLAAMSDAEHAALREKAFAVRFEYGIDTRTVVYWAAGIGAGVVIIISVIVLWSRSLRRQISERLRATAELGENQRILEAVVENSDAMICVKDADGRYLLVNRKWEELAGFRREDTIGRVDHDIFPQENADEYRANDLEAMNSRAMVSTEESILVGGQTHIMMVQKYPLLGPDGTLEGLCGVFNDITERKIQELALAEGRQRLALALDAGDLGTWDFDVATGHNTIDTNYANLLGYSLHELEDKLKDWYDLLLPEDRQASEKAWTSYLAGETGRYLVQYRAHTKQGDVRWMESRGTIAKRDASGKPARITGTIADITERKRAEESLRENLDELEKFNQVAIGRELRMIGLKQEINDLLQDSGKDLKYEIVE